MSNVLQRYYKAEKANVRWGSPEIGNYREDLLAPVVGMWKGSAVSKSQEPGSPARAGILKEPCRWDFPLGLPGGSWDHRGDTETAKDTPDLGSEGGLQEHPGFTPPRIPSPANHWWEVPNGKIWMKASWQGIMGNTACRAWSTPHPTPCCDREKSRGRTGSTFESKHVSLTRSWTRKTSNENNWYCNLWSRLL